LPPLFYALRTRGGYRNRGECVAPFRWPSEPEEATTTEETRLAPAFLCSPISGHSPKRNDAPFKTDERA
jgi:hypothetical protein